MESIKKHDIQVEYFDKKLWVIAGLTDAEKDELQLLNPFRTSMENTYPCSDRAYQTLKIAFKKVKNVLAMQGYEYELVELAGHEGLFARSKKDGGIRFRIHTDDKVPGE